MRISTKGLYAVRFMLFLAEGGEKGPIALKEVSEAKGISRKYLEQIVPGLASAGLVKSIRGAGGGYQLARPASSITPYDVLRASEGSLSPVDFDEFDSYRDPLDLNLWKGLDRVIAEYLQRDSLQDIVDRESAVAADSYSI